MKLTPVPIQIKHDYRFYLQFSFFSTEDHIIPSSSAMNGHSHFPAKAYGKARTGIFVSKRLTPRGMKGAQLQPPSPLNPFGTI